ncbi:MAG: T9SS type A sorting domain-containing protein [Lentimicrobiaceae bacterium]|nr:T9SS type A sorting domain-containing protein [Lentimicrobiaceae bacterium]
MKRLLILLFAGISFLGYAQKFQLTDNEGNPYTDGHTIVATITKDNLMFGEYVVDITIENLTAVELLMKTMRTNIVLIDGMDAYVCFGICPPSNVFAIDWTIMEGTESYALHIVPDTCYCHFGISKFKLEFWSEKDESDKMTLLVEIDMQPVGIIGQKPENVSLSAFPNPALAHSKINVSYTLADKNDKNCLVIRNIMGAMVMNIPLNDYENNITIDISDVKPGVYFYAIESKNRISIAKKLIVK